MNFKKINCIDVTLFTDKITDEMSGKIILSLNPLVLFYL